MNQHGFLFFCFFLSFCNKCHLFLKFQIPLSKNNLLFFQFLFLLCQLGLELRRLVGLQLIHLFLHFSHFLCHQRLLFLNFLIASSN